MHDQEMPKTDPPGDSAGEDDGVNDINDDNVKSAAGTHLSTDATRSKSEQDLARTHSLDLLTVCYFVIYSVSKLVGMCNNNNNNHFMVL